MACISTSSTRIPSILKQWSLWLALLCVLGLAVVSTRHSLHYTSNSDNNDPIEQVARRTTSSVRRRQLDSRIVGGSDAPANAYPWHAQWADGCGSSLIHGDLLLTAAHCHGGTAQDLADLTSKPWWLGSSGAVDTGRAMFADSVFVHPRYSPADSQINDFMIVKLNTTVTDITPVKLNTDANYPTDGQLLTVIGYGTLSEGGKTPDWLQQLTLPMIADCSPYDPAGNVRPEYQFCAGVPEGGKDSCQGDSGGPIMDASGLQVGTVSWGIGCARPLRPGVYARTSLMSSWLKYIKCQQSSLDDPNCLEVEVKIQFNGQAPEETGFYILDTANGNQEMVIEPPGSFKSGQNQVTKTYKVPAGSYVVKIEDTGQDGTGSFTVTTGGQDYTNDGQFSGSETTFPIEVREPGVSEAAVDARPPTEAPTAAPVPQQQSSTQPPPPPATDSSSIGEYQKPSADGQSAIQVDVMYDSRPDQVVWRLVKQEDSGSTTEIYQSEQSTRFITATSREVVKIRYLAPGNYALQVTDSGGDGMSIRGHVRVFQIENVSGSIESILWSIRGDAFTDQAEGRFSLG